MSPKAKDFYGKDVASAIKEACDTLNVAQENFDIEVIETGSTGIFGLIRKKAHIRVTVQSGQVAAEPKSGQAAAEPKSGQDAAEPKSGQDAAEPKAKKKARPAKPRPQKKNEPREHKTVSTPVVFDKTEEIDETDDEDNGENGGKVQSREPVEISSVSLEVIRAELGKILELMACPSTVEAEIIEGSVHCKVSGEFEDDLTGEDGRTLDSLQYLLRKIVSRKISERVRLAIDVGDYRERRNQELREKAVDCAALVKQNGKTQVIASLNPSERRIVHVVLQDDTDIRSRSVGDGLFKKVLIYKPGKGKTGGRKKGRPQNRKKSDSSRKKDS